MSDRVTLTDYEARRLLNAIVKEFVQMTAEELEQQATEGNRYRWVFFILPSEILFNISTLHRNHQPRIWLMKKGKVAGLGLNTKVKLKANS